jgi:hypothetical protein
MLAVLAGGAAADELGAGAEGACDDGLDVLAAGADGLGGELGGGGEVTVAARLGAALGDGSDAAGSRLAECDGLAEGDSAVAELGADEGLVCAVP